MPVRRPIALSTRDGFIQWIALSTFYVTGPRLLGWRIFFRGFQFLLPAPEACAQLCVAGVERGGGGREKGEGIGRKVPTARTLRRLTRKWRTTGKKKTRTKQRVSNIFPIFSLQNKTFSSQPRWKVCFRMEILGKCIFSRQDKALSSLDILQFVWISLLFFLPWVFRKFTNEGLHKTPLFLLADFSLSVLSCRCGLP